MAATKAVKKVATKKTTKAVSKKITAGDPLYVVIEKGLMTGKAIGLYTTREAANANASSLDSKSNALRNRYVVQRVDLVG